MADSSRAGGGGDGGGDEGRGGWPIAGVLAALAATLVSMATTRLVCTSSPREMFTGRVSFVNLLPGFRGAPPGLAHLKEQEDRVSAGLAPAAAARMSQDARPVAGPAVDATEARPWSDFVHRVYADLRLSRGWGEPTAVTIPALQLTALCGGVPGEAVQLVVPFSTQRSLCTEELDAVLAEAAAVGALTAVLAMQDDTSVLVYLQLSASSMEP